nr:hypothetical protein [Sulfidibacter corallicola]
MVKSPAVPKSRSCATSKVPDIFRLTKKLKVPTRNSHGNLPAPSAKKCIDLYRKVEYLPLNSPPNIVTDAMTSPFDQVKFTFISPFEDLPVTGSRPLRIDHQVARTVYGIQPKGQLASQGFGSKAAIDPDHLGHSFKGKSYERREIPSLRIADDTFGPVPPIHRANQGGHLGDRLLHVHVVDPRFGIEEVPGEPQAKSACGFFGYRKRCIGRDPHRLHVFQKGLQFGLDHRTTLAEAVEQNQNLAGIVALQFITHTPGKVEVSLGHGCSFRFKNACIFGIAFWKTLVTGI